MARVAVMDPASATGEAQQGRNEQGLGLPGAALPEGG